MVAVSDRETTYPFDLMRTAPLACHTSWAPMVIQPATIDTTAGTLLRWLEAHQDWALESRLRHGALIFRGFKIYRPQDFEALARLIDPELQNEYLGTSPRVAYTDYVFSASELPGYYPIPQHCEMSFLPKPPRSLFFWCHIPPAEGTGETPLADFREVARQMDPAVKQRFEQGGLRIVRNYSGPSGGGKFDLWKLKRWDEMFSSADRATVEKKCLEQGFEVSWQGKDKLRLVSYQPAFRRHPQTDEEAWFNHVQVFHLSAASGEYSRIADLRPNLKNRGLSALIKVATEVKGRLNDPSSLALHCTYRDGTEIPATDMEHVRTLIWQNMVRPTWHKGDVVCIDNNSVSHGRLPYSGPRDIAVCWA